MKIKHLIIIILACLLWGTSGIFVRYLAPLGFTSMQMTAVRGCVSLLCFGGYALIFDRSIFRVKLTRLPIFVGVGVGLTVVAVILLGLAENRAKSQKKRGNIPRS